MAPDTATIAFPQQTSLPPEPSSWREVLPTVLDHLENVTHADGAFLLRAAQDGWLVHRGHDEEAPEVRLPAKIVQRLQQGAHAFLFWDAQRADESQPILNSVGADSAMLAPIFYDDALWGVLGLSSSAEHRIWSSPERDALQCMTLLFTAGLSAVRTSRVYEHLSVVDPITSTLNRRGITQRGRLAEQSETSMAVAFIDIDDFKSINDTFGHKAGDEVLVCVCETCRAVLRKKDEIGRWGGDELLILLPETSQEEALSILQRLQRAISELHPASLEPQVRVRMSIGLATFPEDGEDFQSLVDAADERLYIAKRQGGGLIACRQEP